MATRTETILCDTMVVHDLRRGRDPFASMPRIGAAIKAISIVSVGEVRSGAIRAGMSPETRAALEATLRAYVTVGIDDDTATIWSELKAECDESGNVQRDNDLWIAATALRLDCVVASRDGDFLRIPRIRLLPETGIEQQN